MYKRQLMMLAAGKGSKVKFIATGEAAEPILQAAQQQGMTVEQLLIGAMGMFYLLVAVLTLIYQGGMTVYYLRRRRDVEAALQEEDPQ